MVGPTAAFWQQKFEAGQTPWDRGAASPQLRAWLDAGVLAPSTGEGAAARPTRVVVPGCGSGHEVAELALRGFQVVGLDYAPAAVARTRERLAALPPDAQARAQAIQADVLDWDPASLPGGLPDAVYEQTCLCALYPDLWVAYARRLQAWLPPGGRLFALFVQIARPGAAQGEIQGPPYHCDIHGMRALFPEPAWHWPKPPYVRTEHPMGLAELAVVLVRGGPGGA